MQWRSPPSSPPSPSAGFNGGLFAAGLFLPGAVLPPLWLRVLLPYWREGSATLQAVLAGLGGALLFTLGLFIGMGGDLGSYAWGVVAGIPTGLLCVRGFACYGGYKAQQRGAPKPALGSAMGMSDVAPRTRTDPMSSANNPMAAPNPFTPPQHVPGAAPPPGATEYVPPMAGAP